jgi:outer membrane protein assembly factor BamE
VALYNFANTVMRILITCSLILSSLAGCSYLPKINANTFSPYKIDIQQGNYVDEVTVDKLKLGMTRAQVNFVMGTPLITDVFHANRWDYIYTFRAAGKLTEQRRVVLYFKDDTLDFIGKHLGETKADNASEGVKPVDAAVQAIKQEGKQSTPTEVKP